MMYPSAIETPSEWTANNIIRWCTVVLILAADRPIQ